MISANYQKISSRVRVRLAAMARNFNRLRRFSRYLNQFIRCFAHSYVASIEEDGLPAIWRFADDSPICIRHSAANYMPASVKDTELVVFVQCFVPVPPRFL